MSNEEAVKMLRTMQRTVCLGNRKFEDAVECAIKALSEPLQPWEVLAAQAVLSQPEPHWIPVTERLPKDGQYILAYYPEFECGCLVQKYRTIGNYGFVAWMPLPEPFKGVTE